jgi:CRISPR-associated exonuclease Cas4
MRDRPEYDRLVDPAATRTVLTGRECRGVVHKLLAGDADRAPAPVVCSPGEPPAQGVWEPQSVRAVAAAKALAWEREREIPRALVEYPAVGVVRTVRLTTRRKAAYRRTVRAVRAIDGPPARVADDRCTSCAYRETCGPSRRTLRSLLRPGE